MGIDGRFDPILDAALPDARTVLVLGAGRWVNARDLRAPGRWVFGVDVDPAMLENPFLDEAVLCDGISLPFACGSIDLCVARWVVEHISDPPSVLAEVARVVRPGGRLVFITTHRWLYGALLDRIDPPGESGDTPPAFYRANTKPKLRRILSAGGWTEQCLQSDDVGHTITGDFTRR